MTGEELTTCSFDEFVEFFFGESSAERAWTIDDELAWRKKPQAVSQKVVQLFSEPQFLLSKYSREQIKAGFQFLIGPDFGLRDWLWRPKGPLELRKACIEAMESIFSKMFTVDPIDDLCFMWWDILRYFGDDADPKTADIMLAVLSRLLKLDNPPCQASALHGLGHLDHPDRGKIIDRFLNDRRLKDSKLREYALAAKEGNVL